MRLRHTVLSLGLAGTGWLWLQAQDEPVAAAIAQPRPRPVAHAHASAPARAALLPRSRWMAQRAHDHSGQLFGGVTDALPEPETLASDEPQPTPPAPSAPALPFSYLGRKLEAGEWEVFLVQGEQTLLVRQGSLIDGLYRVDTITPPELSLTYLPLGERQILPIGEAP